MRHQEFAAREISVFAIDARKDMHYLVQPVSDPDVPQIDEKPRTAFQLAVRAVRLALETQIITREQDLFAVFLYNTVRLISNLKCTLLSYNEETVDLTRISISGNKPRLTSPEWPLSLPQKNSLQKTSCFSTV